MGIGTGRAGTTPQRLQGLLTVLLVAALGTGCSLLADEEASTAPTPGATADAANDHEATTSAAGVIDLTASSLAPASPTYTVAVCAVDPFSVLEEDSPLGTLVEQYRAVEATSDEEQTELDRIVSALEAVRDGDAGAITDASSILRARCTRVVRP